MEHRNAHTTLWTTEIVDCLRQEAGAKQSANQIAVTLTERFKVTVTGSAVVGKCHRENIKLDGSPVVFSDEVKALMRERAKAGDMAPAIANFLRQKGFDFTRKQVTEWCRRQHIKLTPVEPNALDRMTMRQRMIEKSKAAALDWTDHESAPLPSSKPMPLLSLKDHNCKWPLGRDADGARLFCGGFKLSGTNPNRPIPYCTHHQKLSVDQERTTSSHAQKQAA